MRLSAGAVILADGTLLRNVTVTVNDGVIADISPGIDRDATFYAVITPMFHNGHSHTEYQLLSGIVPPGPFFPWVRNVVRLKMCLSQRLWALSTFFGVQKLLEMGYASTEDCSDSGFATAIMVSSCLNGTSYREINGLIPDADTRRCHSTFDALSEWTGRCTVGIAPHAIYSTCEPVLDIVSDRAGNLPVCIHVDESPEEDLFCRRNDGPFVDMYNQRGINYQSPLTSAVSYFCSKGLVTSNTLLVHGGNWTSDDVAIVKRQRARVAICPESNHFLMCKVPPVELLYESNVPIVIGTDSALSCKSMSPLHQLSLLLHASSDTSYHRWLFHSQVTRESGDSYDLRVGDQADFCAYGRELSLSTRSLAETISQVDDLRPDVFRSGIRMRYMSNTSLFAELRSVVKELANP